MQNSLLIVDLDECANPADNKCSEGCGNTYGGYYCTCPANLELAETTVKAYDSEIPESQCRGFPSSHRDGYVCESVFGACTCLAKSDGQRKLVAKTGGCLSKYHIIASNYLSAHTGQ